MRATPALSSPLRPLRARADGGFCTIRSILSACRPRVAALMVQFPPFGGALDMGRARPCASYAAIPPFGGGEAAVRGSVAPKVQTTSAKNAEIRLS